jgi:glutathione S-transferase
MQKPRLVAFIIWAGDEACKRQGLRRAAVLNCGSFPCSLPAQSGEKKLMLEVYHTDHSVCSQKVRVCLGEKGLDYVSKEIDIVGGEHQTPEYLALNPKAVVPTLVHDGRPIIDSTIINEYIDDTWPEPSLKPDDPYERQRMRQWTKRLDDKIHYETAVITYGIAFREMQLARLTPEEIKALQDRDPDPEHRARRKEAMEKGMDSRFFHAAVKLYKSFLDDMEKTLSKQPWLAGKTYSLADTAYTAYITRVNNLRMIPLLDERPHLKDWFERIRARPSYEAGIGRFWNPTKVRLLNQKGEAAWPKVKSILEAA